MACYAVVDIGTHSALLLIATVAAGEVEPLVDLAKATRLGEGLVATGEISAAAVERLLGVLRGFQAVMDEYSLDTPIVFATAAFRRATNGVAIAQRIAQELGWSVQILGGEAEARWTFEGVMQGLQSASGGEAPDQDAIAVDIGGGSTEVIVGSQAGIQQQWSFPVGAVVLQDAYQLGDCLSEVDEHRVDTSLKATLQPITELPGGLPVLLTGGTATTLVALGLELTTYDPQQVDGHRISREQLTMMYGELNRLTASQRADLPGMEPERAQVILPAMRILIQLLELLRAENFTVTVRGARYGLLAAEAGAG